VRPEPANPAPATRATRATRATPTNGLRLIFLALLGLIVLAAGSLRRALPGRGAGLDARDVRRVGAGALALVGLLAVMRLTAPPVVGPPVSPDAPPTRAAERLEGIVLSSVDGATSVNPEAEAGGAPGGGRGTVLQVRITSGSQRGREARVVLPAGQLATASESSAAYRVGDRVLVSYTVEADAARGGGPAAADAELAGLAGDDGPFRVVDHIRWPWLLWGMGALTLVIAVVAGWMGLRALTALVFAVFVLWWFVVPHLLAGHTPVIVALVGCTLIAVPALMLTHGPNREGFVPLGGMAGSLVLVGLLAAAVVQLARLSGLGASEEISLLYVGSQGAIDPQGLLLAAMLIGVVGGLVDVTVGQSAAVFEFHDADPSASRRELFRRGMNVGRAHVAATVHTLVLAYAGAALPTLMLIAMYAAALGDIWNREMIVAEIVRALAGSIGLAAAMPLTTWLACLTCHPAPALRSVPSLEGAAGGA
jgi:uncharacterized membrane protein